MFAWSRSVLAESIHRHSLLKAFGASFSVFLTSATSRTSQLVRQASFSFAELSNDAQVGKKTNKDQFVAIVSRLCCDRKQFTSSRSSFFVVRHRKTRLF